MPLNLFGSSSDSESSERLGGGRFYSGMQDENGEPLALASWRACTADPDGADALAELLGGEIEELDTDKDEIYQILGEATSIDVILNPGAIFTSLVLWGNNQKVAETDGEHLIEEGMVTNNPSPLTAGKPLDEILAMGFKPSIRVFFTLADAPELGSFVYYSQSKTALEEFGRREAELAEMDGPATATLELEEITTKKGRTFTKPVMSPLAHMHAETDDANVEDNEEDEEQEEAPAKKVAKKATRKAPTKKAAAKKAPAKKVAKKTTKKAAAKR